MKRDGTFSIQVLGDKEIIIHQSDASGSYERLAEDETMSSLAQAAKLSASCASRINMEGVTSQRATLSVTPGRAERIPRSDKSADRRQEPGQRDSEPTVP